MPRKSQEKPQHLVPNHKIYPLRFEGDSQMSQEFFFKKGPGLSVIVKARKQGCKNYILMHGCQILEILYIYLDFAQFMDEFSGIYH